jgi:hypothetical protein
MSKFSADHHAFRASIVVVGLLIAGLWLPSPGRAHMHGMFATKAEAEKRAAELKCKGVFAMGTMWMPCANERALHDALQREQ